jgi:2-amino-4-hydroxy-6-hydroxymethyldihydropteridine diphosphokinase
MTKRRAAIGLGSNVGDRLGLLQGAVDALADAPGIEVVAVSPVYETEPVGGPKQPRFLNAVILVDTTLDAATLLERAFAIETAYDRTREVHWGPRTLDVDLLVVGDEVRADPALTLPHPRAHERAFVLVPWHAVDPAARLPGHGPVADLVAALVADIGDDAVQRRDDLVLEPPA